MTARPAVGDCRWTAADRETVASLVRGLSPPSPPGVIELRMTAEQFADLVLDALTAAASPAALCGHRWLEEKGIPAHRDRRHECQLDPDHTTDPGPMPRPHRCRCGATTTEGTDR